MEETRTSVKGYKAFNPNMTCRGKQYEVGKVYEEDVIPSVCNRGMHFCENPLDTLNYYNLVDDDGNVCAFAEVEALGVVRREKDKSCTDKLKIGAKLDLKGFIKASFEFLKETNKENSKNNVVYSGYCSKVATSGYYSQVATSGYYSQVATSGYYSQVATSGDYSQVALNGEYSVGACVGYSSIAKGKVGDFFCLTEWKKDDELDKWIPINMKATRIDGVVIKEDTWYKLVGGEFVEC